MPKKSRQAHIPSQIRRRKARKPGPLPAVEARPATEAREAKVDAVSADQVYAERTEFELPGRHGDVSGPAETRPHRRLALLHSQRAEPVARQQGQPATRSIPGLPSFDRAYLASELRQITIVAGSLLALIVVLAVVLR